MRENISRDALAACMEAANQSLYTCRSLQEHITEERGGLELMREAAEEAGRQEDAGRIMSDIMSYGSALSDLQRREEFLDRRLDHAVKCLIRKKLYAEGAEDLMALCEDRGMLEERAVLQMIRCTMGTRIMAVEKQGELDNNCWKIGIDLAMLECEPELASSDGLYGPVLERNIGRIFADVMLAAYGSKLAQLLESENYRQVIDSALADKYGKNRDEMAEIALPGDIVGYIMDALRDQGLIPPDQPELQAQLDDARSKLREQENAMRKAVAPVQAQVDKATSRISELEAELKAANARNEELQAALAERDRKLSENAALVHTANLPQLPDTNVIFAGGHPNMTKKLMQDHPGWTFIDGRDVNFPEFRNPVLIFFWDQHISHPTFHRVRKFAHPSVPQAYLKSTNLDMLEEEMCRAWAAAKPGNA